MKRGESMYQNMANCYDSIFPPEGKYRFITRLLANHGLAKFGQAKVSYIPKLLDIGCSNGRLAFMLAQSGYDVTAFDLNPEMIAKAKAVATDADNPRKCDEYDEAICSSSSVRPGALHLLELNMLDVPEAFAAETFDCAYCVGNTLVHLEDDLAILRALRGFASVIKSDGLLVIQILPYASILKKRPMQLPLIDNDVLRFERFYDYTDCEEISRIRFRTRLTIKTTGESWQGEEELYPITESVLTALLRKAGFQVIETYGSFAGEPVHEDSPALILVCKNLRTKST